MNLTRLFSVCSILLATGCSFSPYNGQAFSSRSSSIPFEGCSPDPNSPISVLALPPSDFIPDFLGTTTSASTVSYTDSVGLKWYCWSKSVVIPTDAWVQSPNGSYSAVVAAVDNGRALWTYNNDASLCQQPAGEAQLTGAAPCAVQPQSSGAVNRMQGAIKIVATGP